MTPSNQPINEFLEKTRRTVNEHLEAITESIKGPKTLLDAMEYSVKAGGKRVRPILLLATLDAFEESLAIGLDVACAIELVHTYSLIHDDLPAMDDDDLRRGRPTNHKVFGEATAILAGDALLTYSFELIASFKNEHVPDDIKVELIRQFAHASGAAGMVGGQSEDLIAENKASLSVEELEAIHYKKTGKLIIFSVVAGALLARANTEQKTNLEQFAYHLGIAFQIRDDILDIEGDIETIGKPVGSDDMNEKSTYPKLLSLEGAKQKLLEHSEKAIHFLENANINHERLVQIARYIINRDN